MKKVSILFFLFFFSFLLPQEALSFSYNSLSVKPESFEVTANPGDRIENVIRVQNLGGSPIELSPVVKNLRPADESGAVLTSEDDSFYPLAPWISVLSEEEEILPGEVRIFSFKIDVPKSAEPGSYFGSVVFKKEGKDIGGSLVFLRVFGPAEEKLRVENFYSDKKVYETGPVLITLGLRNEGGVHLRPVGKVVFYDLLGRKRGEVQINFGNILPGDFLEKEFSWEKRFLSGIYRVMLDLKAGKQEIKGSFYFVGFPVKIFLLVLVTGILLLLLKALKKTNVFKK